MTSQLLDMNSAQALIYSKSNIRRAFPEFDDTEIAGIYKQDDDVIIVRHDGTNQKYDAALIRNAFQEFTSRVPDFFSYLGPNYRGPSVWRNNCYILFKGWLYSQVGAEKLFQTQAQYRWADKFSLLDSEEKVTNVLNEYNLGYIVSPDGRIKGQKEVAIGTDEELPDDNQEDALQEAIPHCNCGSFQQQTQNLTELQAEIPGYEPICKHIAYMRKFREFCVKRSNLIEELRGGLVTNATAWHYTPPGAHQEYGNFRVIYTKSGQMATLDKWRIYNKNVTYTQHDVWQLLDNMLANKFVPFPLTALGHISHAFKTN
jgi:hypothetical protein